jgi:hypothetical protein
LSQRWNLSTTGVVINRPGITSRISAVSNIHDRFTVVRNSSRSWRQEFR